MLGCGYLPLSQSAAVQSLKEDSHARLLSTSATKKASVIVAGTAHEIELKLDSQWTAIPSVSDPFLSLYFF